jgi:hypothetical protein
MEFSVPGSGALRDSSISVQPEGGGSAIRSGLGLRALHSRRTPNSPGRHPGATEQS